MRRLRTAVRFWVLEVFAGEWSAWLHGTPRPRRRPERTPPDGGGPPPDGGGERFPLSHVRLVDDAAAPAVVVWLPQPAYSVAADREAA